MGPHRGDMEDCDGSWAHTGGDVEAGNHSIPQVIDGTCGAAT